MPSMRSWPIRQLTHWATAVLCAAACCRAAEVAPVKEPRADDPPSIGEVMVAAFQGDAKSQFTLGLMYEQRDSFTNAVRWYRKSADQGNAEAQFKIGWFHTTGQGVPRDYAQAARWFQQAAEKNLVAAQYNLAVCCEKGYGLPTNYAAALTWYMKAAAQGDEFAQKAVGVFYERGKGVPVDLAEAYKWYHLAAGCGNPDGIKLRDLLLPRLTPQQLAEAGRRYADYAASQPGGNLTARPATAKPRPKPADFLE